MHLTDTQRAHLERRLLDERQRLTKAVNRFEDESSGESEQGRDGDLTSMPLHMADQGTDTMQQELDASIAARESNELTEIDEALQKLYKEPERFGICEQTGAEISFDRLDVIPWARTVQPGGEPQGG